MEGKFGKNFRLIIPNSFWFFKISQQAYNATAVIRQMRKLAMCNNSSTTITMTTPTMMNNNNNHHHHNNTSNMTHHDHHHHHHHCLDKNEELFSATNTGDNIGEEEEVEEQKQI